MVLRLGKELGARHPDVEECAGMVRVSQRREHRHGLVVCRAAHIEDEPAVAIFIMTGSPARNRQAG